MGKETEYQILGLRRRNQLSICDLWRNPQYHVIRLDKSRALITSLDLYQQVFLGFIECWKRNAIWGVFAVVVQIHLRTNWEGQGDLSASRKAVDREIRWIGLCARRSRT